MANYDKIISESEKSKVPFLFVLVAFKDDKTLSGLSKHIGISRQAVHGWKGGSTPSSTNLMAAAEYLDTPLKVLTSSSAFCEYIETLKAEDEISQKNINQISQQICTRFGS
tara:strand:- start:897 stop:1229 length:333 start_codon:yes stop_codon:yes gene_type:complete